MTTYPLWRLHDDEDSEGAHRGGNGHGNGQAPAPLADAGAALVRRAPDSERADELTLVLTALGIPTRVLRLEDGAFGVAVPAAEAGAALRALEHYDRDAESDVAERAPRPAPVRGSGGLGLMVGVGLAAFARVTGFWEQVDAQANAMDSRWFAAGAASASRIRAGEWWRAITAMTLHADVMHLGGNVVASAIFIGAVGRWLGWGVALALIVVAGFAANVLTAYVEPASHLSLGASTATFAALGLLVGLQAVHRWRGGGFARRRSWVAFGAGLGLLAMLGMGQQSDVSAHAFGIGWGALLGVGAGVVLDGSPPGALDARHGLSPWVQRGLAVVVLLGVGLCWRVAR